MERVIVTLGHYLFKYITKLHKRTTKTPVTPHSFWQPQWVLRANACIIICVAYPFLLSCCYNVLSECIYMRQINIYIYIILYRGVDYVFVINAPRHIVSSYAKLNDTCLTSLNPM